MVLCLEGFRLDRPNEMIQARFLSCIYAWNRSLMAVMLVGLGASNPENSLGTLSALPEKICRII